MNYLHKRFRGAIVFLESCAEDPEIIEVLDDMTWAEKETCSLIFIKFIKTFCCPTKAKQFLHKGKRKEFVENKKKLKKS